VSDIFQEIDEDLRRDKAQALWAKYQNLVYAAVALLVLGTAGVTGWRIYDDHAREQAGAEYLNALQGTAKDPKAALDVFAKIAETGGPVAVLARFDMARAAVLSDDREKAYGILANLAKDNAVDAPMRGAAALQAGYLALDLGKAAEVAPLVEPLTADGNAYRLLALELTGLAAYQAGDAEKAKQIFTDLAPLVAAPDAPAQMQERVTIMLDRLAR
jgi:hypothetical protein